MPRTAVEESVVLVRPTAGTLPPEAADIVVRHGELAEADRWATVAAEGWSSEGAELAEFVEAMGRVIASANGVHCFLAEIDGKPVAAGGLNMQRDVALLAGASTVPSARRRGAQQALLRARLAFAAERGVDVAMIVTQPQSGSQRNAERQGFSAFYSRTKYGIDLQAT